MGKGDRRSRRGKIFRGTFGKSRSHKTGISPATAQAKAGGESASKEKKETAKKRAPKKKAAEG